MATHTDTAQTQIGASKDQQSRQNHGLPTPESTPGPDDARIAADQERRIRERAAHGSLPPIHEDATAKRQPDHRQGVGDQTSRNDSNVADGGDGREDGDLPPSSSAQIKAIEYLMSCAPKDYRKILSVDPPAEDARQDKENIFNSFRRVGCLVHPDVNNHKDAERAFRVLLKAAQNLGIEKDDINEVRFWDGEDLLGELRLGPEGRWSDAMEGLEDSSSRQPSGVHPPEWERARPHLHRLVQNPDDAGAIAELTVFNGQVVDSNRAQNVPEALLRSFTIDTDTFRAIFREAAPVLEKLRKSHADTKARAMFDAFNEQLRELNRLRQYPEDWTMDLPPEHGPQAPAQSLQSPQQSPGPSHRAETTALTQHGYRRCSRKDGYVKEDGLDKKIEGCIKVGAGHQMLVRRPGKNGLFIYEKVAASTFGKGFAATYNERPDAKTITNGAVEDLKGKQFEDMVIAGVASDRRDPKKEPVDGWSRQPRTIVLVGFGNNPTQFKWYTRSVLGMKFGQALVDEEIDGYRVDSGEHDALQSTADAVDSGSLHQGQPGSGSNVAESATDVAAILARLKALESLVERLVSSK